MTTSGSDQTAGTPPRAAPRGTVIVVPCRNEAERLQPDAFRTYAREDPETGFLFVDDASTDATAEVLARLESSAPDSFSSLTLARHGGKAEAVRRGILDAMRGTPAYIGYWDADLSTPLSAIADLRRQLEGDAEIDLVLGSRVKLLGRRIERNPVRHYAGRVFATAASLVLDLPVYDTQCGAKLLRNGPHLGHLFGEPFRARWIFDVELLARYLGLLPPDTQAERRIVEFPLHEWIDVGGSRLRARDFLRAPLDLTRIYLRYRPRRASRGRARNSEAGRGGR